MVYIEPLQLNITVLGEQLSPTVEENQLSIPSWPDTHDWAFNKLTTEDFNVIGPDMIYNSLQSSLEELFSPIKDVDDEFAETITRNVLRRHDREDITSKVLYKDNIILVPGAVDGHLFVVSNYKNDVRSIVESFETKLSDFSEIASDFGLQVELLTGEEFAKKMTSNLEAEVVEREGFDNTTEESVYNEIKDRITQSIDSNVTLRFGEEDSEVFEYDLLLFIDERQRILIEIKDASHEGAELRKPDLITTPSDKASILKSGGPFFWGQAANTNFVIVKHMEDDIFEEQKRKAERRNIKLHKYEDGDYLDALEKEFRNMTYRAMNIAM